MTENPLRPAPGTPAYYARMARVALVVAPLGALFVYLLAKLQGGDDLIALQLAAIMALATLAAAALLHFRGSKAASNAGWLHVLLKLFVRR